MRAPFFLLTSALNMTFLHQLSQRRERDIFAFVVNVVLAALPCTFFVVKLEIYVVVFLLPSAKHVLRHMFARVILHISVCTICVAFYDLSFAKLLAFLQCCSRCAPVHFFHNQT